MGPERIAEEEMQVALRLFNEGKSLNEISKEIHRSYAGIRRALIKKGAQMRGNVKPRKNRDRVVEMYESGMSLRMVAEQEKLTEGAIWSILHTRGIHIRDPKEAKKNNPKFGDQASNWRGGRRSTAQGHIYIYQPEHPYSTKEGYVMEHRLVMESKLNRILNPEEIVHHLNGNKEDNRIENLEVCTRGEHTRSHFKALQEADRLRSILIKNGIEY